MQNLENLNVQVISLEDAMSVDGGDWSGNWFERMVDAFIDEFNKD